MDRTGFLTEEQRLAVFTAVSAHEADGTLGNGDDENILGYMPDRTILVFADSENDVPLGDTGDAVLSSSFAGGSFNGGGANWFSIGRPGNNVVDDDEEANSPVFADIPADYDYLFDGGRLVVFPSPVEGTEGTDSPFNIVRLPFSEGMRAIFNPPSPSPPAANTPPVAENDTATTEAATPVVIDLLANDSDPDADELTVTTLGEPANGTVALEDDGTVTYTPDDGFDGEDSFVYTIDDGRDGTAEATVTVTVDPAPEVPVVDSPPEPSPETPPVANTPPVAADDTATTQAATAVVIDLTANDSDPDGDPLTVATLGDPANGTVTLEDGTVTYTPADGFTGEDSFTYTVEDGQGGTAEATATVTVESAPNPDPVAENDTATTSAGAAIVIDLLANDSDPEGDPLAVASLGDPANGTVALNEDGTVTYTPNAGFTGSDSFIYTVEDGQGGSAEATATVAVEAAPNTDPVAENDTATTSAGAAVVIDLLANDSDPEADPLAIASLGEPANGTVLLNDDGTVTYTPAAGFTGDDSFTYTIDDGQGGSAEATATVTVEPAVNTDPVAENDTATTQAATAVVIDLTANDSDPDGDPLAVASLGDPANGTVELNPDGQAVYTPNLGFIGEDSFTYTIADGRDGSAEATATVTVEPEPGALVGTEEPDVLVGEDPVQNVVYGLGGDDVVSIATPEASALIYGGDGSDTVVFDDDFAAFAVSFADEALIVDAAGDAETGTRTLYEVEQLQFADATYAVVDGSLSPVETPPEDPDVVDNPGGTGTSLADMIPQGMTAPAVPQAGQSGDIVGFGFQGASSEPQWVTIGQAFVQGDLRGGEQLALDLGGDELPVQMDVKATHGDGSVRHAMLTFELPAAGSGTRTAMLEIDPIVQVAAQGTITAQSVLNNAGYDLQLKLDFADGTTTTIDAKQTLADALAQDTVKTWMQGPQASEFVVKASINEHLDAEFAIRAYADGQVRTDVIVRNETTYTPGIKTYTYDAAIIQDGAATVSHSGVEHYRNANWHEVVWNEGEPDVHVIRDMAYLADTGAIPTYDLSIGVRPQSIASEFSKLAEADTGPLGNALIDKAMPKAGGRADIGPMTRWTSQYLMSQDEDAYEVMMAQADAAGSVPWQYRDEATGETVSLNDRPTLWFDTRGNKNPDAPAEGWPTDRATQIDNWQVDVAHQPSLSFVPYMLTGDHYHLENLQMQANYVMGSYNPGYRGFDEGIVNQGQARSVAWGLRALGDAAWITPDAEANKAYFTEKYQTNLDYHVAAHVNGDTSAFSARALGYGDATGELRGIWYINTGNAADPWMHDFIATTLGTAVARDYVQATSLSGHLGEFIAGRFINGENGFDPQYGAPYYLEARDPGTGRIYDTWAELWEANYGPDGRREGAADTLADRTGLEQYPIIARAGLASIISATGDLEAIEAYAFVLQNTSNPGVASSNPTFGAMAPRFADGSYLQYADIIVGTDNSDTITGNNRNELIIGVDGNNTLTGGSAIDWIVGGPGNDTLRGGRGDDYLIGGPGNDRLIAGLGSDQMKGGSGADTFVIDAIAPGDRNVIHDFDVLQDTLEVSSSLVPNRQSLLNQLSVQEGGIALALPDNATLFLKGLVADDLQVIDVVVS